VLGGPADLAAIVEETGAQHVVLAFLSSRGSDAKLVPLVRQCDELGLQVSLVPRLWESMNIRAALEHIGGMPLFRLHTVQPKGWQFALKHALDRLVAAALILLLSPLLIGATLAVRLSSPGPIFFRQRRIGRDGRAFTVNKFRSMYVDSDERPHREYVQSLIASGNDVDRPGDGLYKLGGDARVTRVGACIRRWSLDELPQLWNVVRGDMSLVGPRPVLAYEVDTYPEWYQHRFAVKPGMTGLWQVSGRNERTYEEMVRLDCEYVDAQSLWLDVRILLRTVITVLRREGVA
jgi:exopolysaccharide biosynthesis polyprenyl glycosylphosphotransferase